MQKYSNFREDLTCILSDANTCSTSYKCAGDDYHWICGGDTAGAPLCCGGVASGDDVVCLQEEEEEGRNRGRNQSASQT